MFDIKTGSRAVALLFVSSLTMAAEQDTAVQQRAIQAALAQHSDELMALPGVTGTALGLCNDLPCIKVFVSTKSLELEQAIRALVKECPVELEETAPFRARPDETP